MNPNTWPSYFLSESVTTMCLRRYTKPQPSGSLCFPSSYHSGDDHRVANLQEIHSWFVRCADAVGGYQNIAVEDNIAVIGKVLWTNNALTYANIQALVLLEGKLSKYYEKGHDNVQYFRLDLDLVKRGRIFREPQPHLHTKPNDEPRLPFHVSSDKSLVLDFFEFLYLNYAYDKWLIWARNLWQRKTSFAVGKDPFDRMVEDHPTAQLAQLLNDHLTPINRFRLILKHEKCRLAASLNSITPDALALNYGNLKSC